MRTTNGNEEGYRYRFLLIAMEGYQIPRADNSATEPT